MENSKPSEMKQPMPEAKTDSSEVKVQTSVNLTGGSSGENSISFRLRELFTFKKFSGFLALVIVVTIFFFAYRKSVNLGPIIRIPGIERKDKVSLETFSSKQDFIDYIESSGDFLDFGASSLGGGVPDIQTFDGGQGRDFGVQESLDVSRPQGFGAITNPSFPSRVSTTNVQVKGIDEPDILKTDGDSIFYSSSFTQTIGMPEPDIFQERRFAPIPPRNTSLTKVIDAFPPADLKEIGSIDKQGDLLLSENNLVVFSEGDIFGYDVGNPSRPKKNLEP